MTSQPMKMPVSKTQPSPGKAEGTENAQAEKMPTETNRRLRSLAHDLSNSIETIMQASYLLAQAELDETNKKWLGLVDQAARDAARINREIRDILREQAGQ